MNRTTCSCLLAALFSLTSLYGQLGTQGGLVGIVVDPSDAVVSGASVTVRNLDTGLEKSAVTNDAGIFEVLALPVGPYTVKVAKPGFRTWTLESTQLTVGERRRVSPRGEIETALQRGEFKVLAWAACLALALRQL